MSVVTSIDVPPSLFQFSSSVQLLPITFFCLFIPHITHHSFGSLLNQCIFCLSDSALPLISTLSFNNSPIRLLFLHIYIISSFLLLCVFYSPRSSCLPHQSSIFIAFHCVYSFQTSYQRCRHTTLSFTHSVLCYYTNPPFPNQSCPFCGSSPASGYMS